MYWFAVLVINLAVENQAKLLHGNKPDVNESATFQWMINLQFHVYRSFLLYFTHPHLCCRYL